MPHNGNGNGNGQALVASERPSQPADTGWLARLQALDREAVSRRIASCERPKELKTLLDEIHQLTVALVRTHARHQQRKAGRP